MKLRLFSIGKDRRLFEYDIQTANMEKLDVLKHFDIEK